MCTHDWKVFNDVMVCSRCGLTLEKDTGKFIMFDRAFINVGSTKNSKKRRKRK